MNMKLFRDVEIGYYAPISVCPKKKKLLARGKSLSQLLL